VPITCSAKGDLLIKRYNTEHLENPLPETFQWSLKRVLVTEEKKDEKDQIREKAYTSLTADIMIIRNRILRSTCQFSQTEEPENT